MQDTARIILGENNKSLGFDAKNDPEAINKMPYKFKVVRFLDLHKAIDDHDNDKISQGGTKHFNDAAQSRKALYLKAAQYAMDTDQPELLRFMDRKDIRQMAETADRLMQNHVTTTPKLKHDRNVVLPHKKTVSLDNKLTDQMQKQIIDTVNEIDLDNNFDTELDNMPDVPEALDTGRMSDGNEID